MNDSLLKGIVPRDSLTLEINEQALRDNFAAVLRRLRAQEQQIQLLQAEICRNADKAQEMVARQHRRVDQLAEAQEDMAARLGKQLRELEETQRCLRLGLSEQEARVSQMASFKKHALKKFEIESERFENVKDTLQNLGSQNEKIQVAIQRKVERTEIEKLRKEVTVAGSQLGVLSSKCEEMQIESDGLLETVRQVEVRKLNRDELQGVLQEFVDSRVAGLVAMVEQSNSKSKDKKRQAGTSRRPEESKVDLVELEIKVNKLIELEKGRDPRSSRDEDHPRPIDLRLNEGLKTLEENLRIVERRLSGYEDKQRSASEHQENFRQVVFEMLGEIRQHSDQHLSSQLRENSLTHLKELRALELRVDQKLSVEEFRAQNLSTEGSFRKVHDLLELKPFKADVKKALQFLELRLKELIRVVREEEGDFGRTAAKFKCMSCEKDLGEPPVVRNLPSRRTRQSSKRNLYSPLFTNREVLTTDRDQP